MNVKLLPRIFEVEIDHKTLRLTDPSPAMTVKQVVEHYSNMYPELTNSKFKEPKVENDELVYKISTDKGTHG